ncbi:hypothetical protein [Alteromonas sp. a30]|uniref:hypothetical protein n=1 Tax=Alteromonas sp. a30 TaxID=2730917 RepID=UPI0022828EC4|nr:hypothetical protein [Alteromonas sp. a30]MCY7295813.1 hypothetical protein [Alteromonas sp. a30]
MTLGDILSPLIALVRMASTVIGRRKYHPYKDLRASLIGRGIISELPRYIPYHICDENGDKYKGIYIISLMLRNRGNQPIIQSDILASAPLRVSISEDARLAGTKLLPIEDQTDCYTTLIDKHTFSINFDCLNPNEYISIPVFITGNPWAEVKVSGRIIGQDSPIDHTAEEVKASLGERVVAFLMLILLLNTVPSFFIGGYFILRDYGMSQFWNAPENIPEYLMVPFIFAVFILFIILYSKTADWFERRKYPEGYPLYNDLEPSLFENVKGMLRTIFKGKKQRISKSLFSWGKPVMMTDKKVKKRTVDDWIV